MTQICVSDKVWRKLKESALKPLLAAVFKTAGRRHAQNFRMSGDALLPELHWCPVEGLAPPTFPVDWFPQPLSECHLPFVCIRFRVLGCLEPPSGFRLPAANLSRFIRAPASRYPGMFNARVSVLQRLSPTRGRFLSLCHRQTFRLLNLNPHSGSRTGTAHGEEQRNDQVNGHAHPPSAREEYSESGAIAIEMTEDSINVCGKRRMVSLGDEDKSRVTAGDGDGVLLQEPFITLG